MHPKHSPKKASKAAANINIKTTNNVNIGEGDTNISNIAKNAPNWAANFLGNAFIGFGFNFKIPCSSVLLM